MPLGKAGIACVFRVGPRSTKISEAIIKRMKDRLHIDEIRDLVRHLKKGAESLYRYGDPGRAVTIFDNLGINDKKRLIYWALKEGDNDIKNVAKYLMRKLRPTPEDQEHLLTQMDPNDRAEIEQIESIKEEKPPTLSVNDCERIHEVLKKACSKIGFIEQEEAFWILIPENPLEKTLWIQARGKRGEVSSLIRLPSQVDYEPTNFTV